MSMNRPRILILGSTGFVGSNIREVLDPVFTTFSTQRSISLETPHVIHFDIEKEETWDSILQINPNFIINATGYGVVKHQGDAAKMKKINYYQPYLLKRFLDEKLEEYCWIQIGTAFEYDLSIGALYEDSPTMPLTDYGITKLLFSQFLKQAARKNFVILRPFAMFGPREDKSKIIPALLTAQKERTVLPLSQGVQQRDYFFVKDLAYFIMELIRRGPKEVEGEVINIGSNNPIAIKDLALNMSRFIPDFNPSYWCWGQIEQRVNEGDAFFNASQKASELGFTNTGIETAFQETINYYYSVKA